METTTNVQDQIREEQKASWNKFSPGWKKWDDLTMEFLEAYGAEMINMLDPTGSDHVLDVAAGTGEPGLTIASMLDEGKVTITDLSAGMLEVAAEKANEMGLTNVEAIVASVDQLPFEDNTFDAVSCRMGFMFFPDMQKAADELARVTKPGGKVVAAVWGPAEKNFWISGPLMAISKYVEVTPPPPGAPSLFRCGEPGTMKELFEKAGLKNVTEEVVTGKFDVDAAETMWELLNDVAAPFEKFLSGASQETLDNIKTELVAMINEKFPDEISFDTMGYVVYGEK